MLKTWLERMPTRLPKDQLNCTLQQVSAMQAEIDELKTYIRALEDETTPAFTALLAENDALRDDAERYRWLRDMDMLGSPSIDLATAFQKYTGSMLDGYIDAAIKGTS